METRPKHTAMVATVFHLAFNFPLFPSPCSCLSLFLSLPITVSPCTAYSPIDRDVLVPLLWNCCFVVQVTERSRVSFIYSLEKAACAINRQKTCLTQCRIQNLYCLWIKEQFQVDCSNFSWNLIFSTCFVYFVSVQIGYLFSALVWLNFFCLFSFL